MTTKFSVGDEVYIRCKVIGISVTNEGTTYRVETESEYFGEVVSFNQAEEQLIGADVEDFRRENNGDN